MEYCSSKNCILIVDDDFINREVLKNIFSSQYTFEEAANGQEGLEQIQRHLDKLCAIILDVQMPELTGIELLEIISAQGITEKIPTFLITAQDDYELMTAAYTMGVMDVVSKPVIPVVIQKRIKTVIELFSTREQLRATVKGQQLQLLENATAIDELNRGTIEALATAIEFRDIESGEHVNRIYSMTKYILSSTGFGQGLSEGEIENIARGSIMHDVGKIAISDVILNKPGKLSKEEFEVMKQHTTKGAQLLEQICRTQTHEAYRYAQEIALHHHERWDGKGYPDGLVGDQISIAAQVVSIADVYDALLSPRVYKKAFSPQVAVEMIKNGECGCFNPKLLQCFLEAEPVIRQWYLADAASQAQPTPVQSHGSSAMAPEAGSLPEAQQEAPNAVMDVLLLMTAVQTAYDMIISVNLTKNTYYMIDYARFGTHCAGYDGVFDELIDAGAASVPVSHRKEFHDTFCRENLLQAYHAGRKSVELKHPQYGDDGTLHWVSTQVLFMEDARTGDILQVTLSQYIDKEYAQQEKTRKIPAGALQLAGMDGHIAKPVNFDEAARLLQNAIKKQEAIKHCDSSPPDDYRELSAAGINMQALLHRLMGNTGLIETFIIRFTQDETFQVLRSALARGDWQQAEAASHTLRGICGNLSADDLFALFSRQVSLFRAREFDKAAAMMDTLEEAYAAGLAHMKLWLSRH